MTKFLLSTLVLLAGFNYASAQAAPNATAAELALHRLEKLVILNKVAPEYQSNFKMLTVEVLNPVKPTDPAFKTTLFQSPGGDGMSDMVELLQDSSGKAISNKAMQHTQTPRLVNWPSKDPVTLAELALHYLEDDYSPNDDSKTVFVESINELMISQEKNSAGQLIAVLTMKNSEDERILIFRYSLDGNFISSEIKL